MSEHPIIPSGRPAHCYGCDLLRNELMAAQAHAELSDAALAQAQRRIAELTLEVARLQTGASAVHASAMQVRRALSEVEERAANAALPWRRAEGVAR